MKKELKKAKASGKMICPICENREILVTHHINGREIPNANHPSNLISLCSNCHCAIHYGHIIIEKWMMTSNGYSPIWHKKGEESLTGEDSTPNLLFHSTTVPKGRACR